jgi:hypothetical protein
MLGEANLTFDGTTLEVVNDGSAAQLKLTDNGVGYATIESDNRTILIGENGNAAVQIGDGSANYPLYLGDTACGDMTTGFAVNQGAADNTIISLKSSDVAHSFTNNYEADTYGYIQKVAATTGGLELGALTEASLALEILTGEETNTSVRTTGASGAMKTRSHGLSGTALADCAANSNMVVFATAGASRFIFDSDGDSHQDVGTAWTNFDGEEDAQVCRSVAHVMTGMAQTDKDYAVGNGVLVKSRFDQWGKDHQENLIEMGLIPRLTPEQAERGERPLMNMTQLARVHNGAIWQLHVGQQEMKEHYEERIAQLETQVTNLLEN